MNSRKWIAFFSVLVVPAATLVSCNMTVGPGINSSQDLSGARMWIYLPSAAAVAGKPATVNVLIEDRDGFQVSDANGRVTVKVTGSATGAGPVEIKNGIGTLNLVDTVSETLTVSLSDTDGTGLDTSDSQTLQIVPAAAQSLRLSGPGSVQTGKCAGPYTIDVADSFGNRTVPDSVVSLMYGVQGSATLYVDSACQVVESAQGPRVSSVVSFYLMTPGDSPLRLTVDDNSGSHLSSGGLTVQVTK